MRFSMPFVVVALSGCSVVKSSMVRDDWAAVDQKSVKRLAVVVTPAPDGNAHAGELVAKLARRYANQKRDFLVKKEVVAEQTPARESICGGEDAIEGILTLNMTMVKQGDGMQTELTGSLARCSDGREAWHVSAAGSFASKDDRLVDVTQVYVREIGADVEPYVAPALNLLRPALDTLPQPVLTEDDINEKLTLD